MSNEKKKNDKAIKLIAVFTAFVLVVVFVVVLLSRYSKTRSQAKEIASLSQSVSQIQEENSRVSETLEHADDEQFMEKAAREADYVKPEERVYYDSDED